MCLYTILVLQKSAQKRSKSVSLIIKKYLTEPINSGRLTYFGLNGAELSRDATCANMVFVVFIPYFNDTNYNDDLMTQKISMLDLNYVLRSMSVSVSAKYNLLTRKRK